MTNSKLKTNNCRVLFCILHFAFCICVVSAQSTDQGFPTAVTTNEISGQIKARDIGDARSTAYFYAFNGGQGDVFINVVTANFNGDIDVFTTEGLKTLTKIVVYADAPNNETGRVIYLRKPEKLLLRVEGRSPNDDAATFRIKFAGGFRAAAEAEQREQPKLPEISAQNDSGIVVNSVGTIISVKPKPTPAPKENIARKAENVAKKSVAEETPEPKTGEKPIDEIVAENEPKTEPTQKKVEVIITDDLPEKPAAETIPESGKEKLEIDNAEPKIEAVEPIKPSKTKKPKVEKPKKAERSEKSAAPNPLENVRLVVIFKDGTRIERPMSEVSRVNVDNKGMLTVVSKDGTIGRYSILEVAKFTIE